MSEAAESQDITSEPTEQTQESAPVDKTAERRKEATWSSRWSKKMKEAAPESPVVEAASPEQGQEVPAEEGEEQGDGARAERMDALKKLASELGLEVDEKSVVVKERYNFREEMRAKREKLEEKERAFEQKAESIVQKLEQKYAPYEQLKAAAEKGDADAIAKALGYKNFGAWTEDFALGRNNPERKKLRELEERLKAADEEKAAYAEEQKRIAETREREAREQKYFSGVQAHLASIEDPIIAAFAAEESFAAQIIQVQKENWDPDTRTTLTVDEAAQQVVDNLRMFHQNLSKYFGSQAPTPAQSPPASPKANGAQAGRKPAKAVSQSATADAAGAVLSGMTDQQAHKAWKEKWASKLAEQA